MKDIQFTLEEDEIRKAVAEEYERLGLSLVEIRTESDPMVAVVTPTAAPGIQLESPLDAPALTQAITRRALRVTCLRVTSCVRISKTELRITAQVADDSCPTCGYRLGEPVAVVTPVAASPVPTAATVAAKPATTVATPAAPTPPEDLPPGTAGRVLPVPTRPMQFSDHELVTKPRLKLQKVGESLTGSGDLIERFEVDIPEDMEVPRCST